MIRTARLVLRKPVPEDLDDLFAVFSDPETMRYWSTPPHDREDTRRFLEGMINQDPAQGTDWVIEKDGRAIGKAGAWAVPEVGYALHRAHWGQGLAREAMGALIPELFRRYPDIDRLTADIDPRNIASERVLRALGFVETGRASRTFCINGEWSDSTYFALMREAALRTAP